MEIDRAVRYVLMKEPVNNRVPEKKMKMSDAASFKHAAIHIIIGLCVGFALLHPISMLIDAEASHFHSGASEFMSIWLSGPHWKMSLYFTLLGGAAGIIQGVLVQKIVEIER